MAISCNINTTANQDLWLGRLLTNINTQRVSQGLLPYTDVNALCTDILIDQLKSWVQQMKDSDAQAVGQAYRDATNAQQNQIKTILGL